MPPQPKTLHPAMEQDEPYGAPGRRGLLADLFTGLSLGVFLVLLACVLAGAWLYEGGF